MLKLRPWRRMEIQNIKKSYRLWNCVILKWAKKPQLPYVRRPSKLLVNESLHTTVILKASALIFHQCVGGHFKRSVLWTSCLTQQTNRCCVPTFFYNLTGLLENVCFRQWQHVWFIPDGALPHFIRIFARQLNHTFISQGKEGGGPANWPAWFVGHNSLVFGCGDV
jgi:hypothetical protein